MNNKLLHNYKNGNATIEIYSDGTRIIDYPDNEHLNLDYPLNLDIRVTSRCSFGRNPRTGKSVCSFCHESAKTDGRECDFSKLKEVLSGLPKGIELAIGGNDLSDEFIEFLPFLKEQGYIVNLTMNQGHIKKHYDILKMMIDNEIIYGLGISYRAGLKFDIPDDLLYHTNTILHVIAGIDDIHDIIKLKKEKGIKKILILGEKDFGFNVNNVKLDSLKHINWRKHLIDLITLTVESNKGVSDNSKFHVLSFDNLALEQVNPKRYMSGGEWKEFYQGEHSFYINAVDGTFSPSSRSPDKVNWDNVSIKEYFNDVIKGLNK